MKQNENEQNINPNINLHSSINNIRNHSNDMIKLKYHQGERSDISYATNGAGVDCTHCLATFPENSKNIKKYAGYCYLCDDCKTLAKQTKIVLIGGIEIILDLSKDLQHIDITCCQLGDIHGDVNTIFGDVNTVDGTVNLDITGDVLGEILSNVKKFKRI